MSRKKRNETCPLCGAIGKEFMESAAPYDGVKLFLCTVCRNVFHDMYYMG